MEVIRQVLKSDMKHKERVASITEKVIRDQGLIASLIELLERGSDVERGTCAEVLKFVSKDRPEIVIDYLDTLIEYIDHKASRVRWGVPESIGNLAKDYPDQVGRAIPKLLDNTKDGSTVVRWCAAYALSEIAKHSPGSREVLVPKFNEFVDKEKNNGVRNVYVKALKQIS